MMTWLVVSMILCSYSPMTSIWFKGLKPPLMVKCELTWGHLLI